MGTFSSVNLRLEGSNLKDILLLSSKIIMRWMLMKIALNMLRLFGWL